MTSMPGQPPFDRGQFTYSIVIPVYNSEKLVGTTVDRVVEVFTQAGLREATGDGRPATTSSRWTTTCRTRPTRHCCSSTRR